MNQGVYKLVYSRVLNMYIPASEAVRSRGNKTSKRVRTFARRVLKYTLITDFIYLVFVSNAWAGPAGLVPGSQAWVNASVTGSTSGSMTITQTAPKAILNWQKLNLNAGELLKFNQLGNKNWSALNRIHDANPSILNGAVQADGNVYFINTNGIIFGQNAEFNVGSMYAGSLNITDELFQSGIVNSDSFTKVFEGVGGFVTVEKGAQIHSANGGKVLLFAPTVTNNGVINTPDGQTILAAGNKVYLQSSKDPAGFLVEVDSGGVATNLGKIVAERGNITMMGLAVNQKGTLSATTSVRANGSIFLKAQNNTSIDNNGTLGDVQRDGIVTLAKDSVTEVKPEVLDKEESTLAQPFATSKINIDGSLVNIEGKILAQSGDVKITATAEVSNLLTDQNPEGITKRIFIGNSAEIDVSGVDAVAPMSRNQLTIELFSDQLKDAPVLRDTGLFKETVYVDARKGTSLFDIQPFINLKGATVAEKMVDAGTVTFTAPNDVITSTDSIINISGGSITYESGSIKETNLSYNGNLVPISEAQQGIPYDKTADYYTVTDRKFGVTRVWDLAGGGTEGWGRVSTANQSQLKTTVVGGLVESYIEGGDAGEFKITPFSNTPTKNLVLNGELKAETKVGIQQYIQQNLPNGGTLSIAANQIEIAKTARQLSEDFTNNSSLGDDYQSVISTELLSHGVNHLDLSNSDNTIINDDVILAPQGSIKTGLNALINANLIVPGGDVSLKNATLSDGVNISTAGYFTNDSVGMGGALRNVLVSDAGNISAEVLSIGNNVVIDASAGASVSNAGELKLGNPGDIRFSTASKIEDDVNLRAFGFDQGGALTIDFVSPDSSTVLNIVGNKNTSATDIDIENSFFSRGGFSKYTVKSNADIKIGDGSSEAQEVYSQAQTLRMNTDYLNQVSGQDILAVTTIQSKPEETRNPVSFNFISENAADVLGVITLAENAKIRTDIGGEVSLTAGKQVNILGDILAPSGNINLKIKTNNKLPEDASQAIFIGEESTLNAAGSVYTLPNSLENSLKNRINNAGSINISADLNESAHRGAVVIKDGAILDVSGVSVETDTKLDGGLVRQILYGDAGTISITGRDSMLLDGEFKGAADGTGRDGSLILDFGRKSIYDSSTDASAVLGNAQFKITTLKQLRAEDITVGSIIGGENHIGAQVSTEQIDRGGFANVSIGVADAPSTQNSVVLASGVDLSLTGNLELKSPIINVIDDGAAKINASHITLKNSNDEAPNQIDRSLVEEKNGILTLSANQLYFDGLVGFSGVSSSNLITTQDIHGAGGLVTNGELNLTARQIYPNTPNLALGGIRDIGGVLSFESIGNNSRINVNSSGLAMKSVLSAQGTLSLKAADIVQKGVLSAPFGQIILEASKNLTLAEGSITSVSANNQTIPFWTTTTGGNKLSPKFGQELPLDTLKNSRIDIKAENVSLQKNATLDLSAGGGLFAYEFVPGIGGSEDILSKQNMYAVIPSLSSDYSPYDVLNSNSSSQKIGVGQAVYLTGVKGLESGTYTLLPARYALVPGAFLVEANIVSSQLLPTQTASQLDGSSLTTGYHTDLGTGAKDANWSTFRVINGEVFHPADGAISKAPSQYIITSINDYFSDALNTNGNKVNLPTDVAGLSLEARKLAIDSNIVANKVQGGDGLKVDINAKNIRVVTNVDNDEESLQITSKSLNALNADSLLLGGRRDFVNGVEEITAGAESVSVESDNSAVISTPELILAATDSVVVKSGAFIDTGVAQPNAPETVLRTSGDGALLAVSSNSLINYSRANGSALASNGQLLIEADSHINAGKSVVADGTKMNNLIGELNLEDGAHATFGANRILLGHVPDDQQGLHLNDQAMDQLGKLSKLTLNSYSNVDTYGDIEFGGAKLDLVIDAAGVIGHDAESTQAQLSAFGAETTNSTNIVAQTLVLKNSQGAGVIASEGGVSNSLNINAKEVVFEGGDAITEFEIAGYTNLKIVSDEIRVAKSGEANFNVDKAVLASGRLTSDNVSNYKIAANGQLEINKLSNVELEKEVGIGSSLNIAAKDLTVNGVIDIASGTLELVSDSDLHLSDGAKLTANSSARNFQGESVSTNAGTITLKSENADVNVDSGAEVSVSSQDTADAGKVKILASKGTVNLNGEIRGNTNGTGKAGELVVDVNELTDFTEVNKHSLGFDDSREYRVRTGDVNVTGAGQDAFRARNAVISVDSGKITVSGEIVATAPKNSHIGLFAQNGVTLEGTSIISANTTGIGEKGGKVEIHTQIGQLDLKSNSKINVTGGSNASNGEVHLRAPRTGVDSGNGVAVNQLATEITGAKSVVLEAFRVFDEVSKVDAGSANGSTLGFSTIASDVADFMVNKTGILESLGKASDNSFHLRAGVEVQSDGDLTIGSTTNDWNLYSSNRAGNEPGILTLRAKGNIDFKGTLSDGFTTAKLNEVSAPSSPAIPEVAEVPEVLDESGEIVTAAVPAIPAQEAKPATGVQNTESWSYRIVAGIDSKSANLLTTEKSVDSNSGSVTLANNKGIRTGTGDIDIAAAGDLEMLGSGSVIYTVGREAEELAGFDKPQANLNPLYLADGGDIQINAQGSIIGAESTTNRQLINNWLYRQGGGNSRLDTSWWVRPDLFKQSVATLGGGSLSIASGGNISNFSASTVTSGRYDTNGTTGNQLVEGGGDLNVKAGENIINGVYFVAKGSGQISANKSILAEDTFGTVLALQDGSFEVNTGENVLIEAVINPTLVAQSLLNAPRNNFTGLNSYFNTYGKNASVALNSLKGNVSIGENVITSNVAGLDSFVLESSLTYSPANLSAVAFNGDVVVGSQSAGRVTNLLPSANGNLTLLAENNVIINTNISMSDADLLVLPNIKNPFTVTNYGKFDSSLDTHANELIHKNDNNPALIIANNGDVRPADIANLSIIDIPKELKVEAGRDIKNLTFNIQNNQSDDVSLIKADNDIRALGVQVSGTGELLMQAGRHLDLTESEGTITTIGNVKNAALADEGASITLQAGLGQGANIAGYIEHYLLPNSLGPSVLTDDTVLLEQYRLQTSLAILDYMRKITGNQSLSVSNALAEFTNLSLEAKTVFINRHLSSELLASAKDFAKLGSHLRGNQAIATLFPTINEGDISIFKNKISTNSGGSIDLLAPGGMIAVGAPGVSQVGSADIGVITEKGGAIRAMSNSNFEVNQSKVITQFGSDITVWSTNGAIDAGRGSKTATSVPERIVSTDADGNTIVEVKGVAAGSGIRAQSYDPDGQNGSKIAPDKGKVSLIAQVVDAGEAGIEAGDLLIVAPIVLNATNIQVQGASSGVPVATTTSVVGASAGLSPDAVNSVTAALSDNLAQTANQSFVKPKLPSILSVDIISIGN